MNLLLSKIIEKQKEYVKRILHGDYVERSGLQEAKKMIETDLIKVVVGPRRSGKSIFSSLLLNDTPFAYLNLDEEALNPIVKNLQDYDDLLKEMFAVYGKTKYLFFDEIQNLDRFELFANRLHREGYNLLLTGSNAKLLSKELATHLTGRHLQIEILPFNFQEYLSAKKMNVNQKNIEFPENKGELLQHLKAYMAHGGYPEIVVKNLEPTNYLSTLFDSVIFKDIIKRYNIRYSDKLINVAIYLINNIAAELSSRKLADVLGLGSVTTVEKYLHYLEESYLFFILRRYSYKPVERLIAPRKVYLVDNGYLTAKAVQFSPNHGKFMENLIFSELVKRGFHPNIDLFYYKTRNNKEVDFITRQGLQITSMIQATYAIDAPDVKKREIKALLEANEELNCDNLIMITWDKDGIEKMKNKEIKYIPLWKWLLNRRLGG